MVFPPTELPASQRLFVALRAVPLPLRQTRHVALGHVRAVVVQVATAFRTWGMAGVTSGYGYGSKAWYPIGTPKRWLVDIYI